MGAAGAVSCGTRTCPPCAAKIGRKEGAQIADTLTEHRDTVYHPELAPYGLGGGSAVFASFTMEHHLGQALKLLLVVLGFAWRQLTVGGGYKRLAERHHIVGWIKKLEINWSRVNGFHCHFHVIFLTVVAHV